jgi:hypothetical protein
MKKALLILICLAGSLSLNAQEVLSSIPLEFKVKIMDWQSVSMSNPEKNNAAILLQSEEIMFGALLDEAYQPKHHFKTRAIRHKAFENIIGGWGHEKGYSIFFSDKDNREFALLNFDHKMEGGLPKFLDLDIKGERMLTTFDYNNKFYLLSAKEKSSILVLYTLQTEEGVQERQELRFRPYSHNGKAVELEEVLKGKSGSSLAAFYKAEELQNYKTLVSKNKIGLEGNKLYIIIDEMPEYVEVLSVDLGTYERGLEQYERPNAEEIDGTFVNIGSGSFIKDGKLFQGVYSRKGLILAVNDLKTKEVLGEIKMSYPLTRMEHYPILHYEEDTFTLTNAEVKEEESRTYYATLGDPKNNYERHFKQILKRLNDDESAMAVNALSNGVYHLTVGNIVFLENRYFQYYHLYHPLNLMTHPSINIPSPPRGFGPNAPEMEYINPEAVNVSMEFYIDMNDFSLLEGEEGLPFRKWDEYHDEIPKINRTLGMHFLIDTDEENNGIFGTFDKDSQEYRIIKINRRTSEELKSRTESKKE